MKEKCKMHVLSHLLTLRKSSCNNSETRASIKPQSQPQTIVRVEAKLVFFSTARAAQPTD